MNNQISRKKIGFISAISICFTSVVGIGIFLKNSSVGANVDGNGISWLMTWIITGFLSILLAFHFSKISMIESKKGLTGLNSWVDEISDKKNKWFKRLSFTNYGLFYNPILLICLSFFTTEFFIDIFKVINPELNLELWIYVLISIGFLLFFIFNNYFSVKLSGYISIATSVLKTIPLIMIIVIGISFFSVHNNSSTNGFLNSISIDKAFRGIMISMPSVLFSFDSFIGIGSWSNNVKGGHKTVSKVIILSLIFVTIIYTLICIASIFHYDSNSGTTILNVLLDSLPSSVTKGITIFIGLMIFISAFGTTNSICGSTLNEFKNIIINEKILFSSNIKRRFNDKTSYLILSLIVIVFWSLVIFIPAIIMNNDGIIDGFSNLVVVTIFLIYSYVIYLYWKNIHNRYNKKTSYSILAWVTIGGVFLISILNLYFVFEGAIINPFENASWGLILSGGIPLNNLSVLLIYIAFFATYFFIPFINDYLLMKKHKINIKNI